MPSEAVRVLVACPDEAGGMLHYASNLANALRLVGQGQGVHVERCVVGADDGVPTGTALARALDSGTYTYRFRRYYVPARGRRLARKFCTEFHPNLIHITSELPLQRTLITALKRRSVRTVFTLHDPDPHEVRRSLWSRMREYSHQNHEMPTMLGFCDAIHVHSPALERALRNRHPCVDPRKIYVVQHGGGVPSEIAHGNERAQELAKIESGRPTALFFGRIEPYKGLDVLFEAAVLVRQSLPAFRLIVAGSGQMPAIPAAIATNVITINRHVRDSEVRSIVEASSLVVLPYRSATQTGVVPLLAGFAKPAIVSAVGALPELLREETGIVVPPADSTALAQAMIRLLSNPETTLQMGAAALEHLRSDYSWEVVAARHIQHYRQLMELNA